MNILFSCIGKRGYIADFFRPHLGQDDRIIGTGNSPWAPGFLACDEVALVPDVDAPGYAQAVLELCRTRQVDAILSFHDVDVLVLAIHRDNFTELGVRLLLPPADLAVIALDKYQTYERLTEAGVDTPRTVLTVGEASGLDYPLVVKPRRGSASRSVFIARDQVELEVFYNRDEEMIIQELIEGTQYDIELCGDLDGRMVGFCSWIKHASRLGETERATTFRDGAAFALGERLNALMPVPGPMDVDVIRRDGVDFVLEFNPRFGGGYPVSHLAGADFPRLIVELIRSGSVLPKIDFVPGVTMMKQLQVVGGPDDEFEDQLLGIAGRD
jgi:carbamoyl-phosphate synthase large subunit